MISGDCQQPSESRLIEFLVERAPYLKHLIADAIAPRHRAALDPDDIFQEVCITALQIIPESCLWAENSLHSQLRTIVRWKILDAIRSRRRLKHPSRLHGLPESVRASATSADEPAVPWKTPSREVFSAERAHTIRNLISKLPAEYSHVLQLRYFDGLSLTEIAQRIGKSGSAVNSLLHRARQELRGLLGDSSDYLDW
jgi:RNA polymerase sigma-70 factor (ECF subfamily)